MENKIKCSHVESPVHTKIVVQIAKGNGLSCAARKASMFGEFNQYLLR